MSIKIPDFPHACYDSQSHQGFLAYYYPSAAYREGNMSEENWRHQSWSPEILNFKEGRDSDLQIFVDPFLQLIHQSLVEEQATNAILVPIPSSMPETEARFNRAPRAKGGKRNRDDRMSIFCNLLSIRNTTLQTIHLLRRSKEKSEKASLTIEQQIQTLELTNMVVSEPKTVILIDDVQTSGVTIQACREILSANLNFKQIIALTIGKSEPPYKFQSL